MVTDGSRLRGAGRTLGGFMLFIMVMRVQRVDGEFRVVLTAEAMAALHLEEGAAVEVRSVEANGAGPKIEYATVEESLRAFYETLPQHEQAYIELAK